MLIKSKILTAVSAAAVLTMAAPTVVSAGTVYKEVDENGRVYEEVDENGNVYSIDENGVRHLEPWGYAPDPHSEPQGVQDNYQEYDSKTSKWGGSKTKNAETGSLADRDHDGSIHLEYSNDSWEDPGKDESDPKDNNEHDAYTFILTIPTMIKHTNMKTGVVDTTDTYTVNVRGLIPSDRKVHLDTYGRFDDYNILILDANNDNSITEADMSNDGFGHFRPKDSIKETTTQGKTDWSADETYGSLAADHKALMGTDATDTIKLSGQAKTADMYTGTVAYTATLVDSQ